MKDDLKNESGNAVLCATSALRAVANQKINGLDAQVAKEGQERP